MTLSFADEGRVVANAVAEMARTGVPVTPRNVERVVNAVNEAGRSRDPFGGRQVVGLGVTPRTPDGGGGQVQKVVREGPPVAATFAAAVPYFKLSGEKRAQYEAEAAALRAQLATPGIDPAIKTRLQQDLKKVEHLLGMDASPTPDQRPVEELRTQA